LSIEYNGVKRRGKGGRQNQNDENFVAGLDNLYYNGGSQQDGASRAPKPLLTAQVIAANNGRHRRRKERPMQGNLERGRKNVIL